jgi:DNA-binding XRE family transcriptional regulator
LTQGEVAKQAGCARTTIVSAESGRGSAAAFVQIATCLGQEIGGRSLPPAETFGKRLAALRTRRGLGRRELATMAGVSPTTIAAVEVGDLGHLSAIERIGAALGAGLKLAPVGTPASYWSTAAVSSAHDAWTTPPDLLARLYPLLPNWRFALDPCSPTTDRRKAPVKAAMHYTIADDGLSLPWHGMVFMNPPYGRGIGAWTRKARTEVACGNAEAVLGLLPARLDTTWWHTDLVGHADIMPLRGRLKFGGATAPAPFASALVVWGASDALRRGLREQFTEKWYLREAA